MRKLILTILPLVLVILAFTACTAVENRSAAPSASAVALPSAAATPAATVKPTDTATSPAATSVTPAPTPGKPSPTGMESPTSGISLVKVSGVAKKVSDAMILITSAKDGAEFMLRFSENSKWDAGVVKKISIGNAVTCMVKLEPTFTTPSQGEVYEVLSNTHS